MITEKEYLEALETINKYKEQVNEQVVNAYRKESQYDLIVDVLGGKAYNNLKWMYITKSVVEVNRIPLDLVEERWDKKHYRWADTSVLTFRDLARVPKIWFQETRGLGKMSISEIEQEFRKRGLHFGH